MVSDWIWEGLKLHTLNRAFHAQMAKQSTKDCTGPNAAGPLNKIQFWYKTDGDGCEMSIQGKADQI